MAKENKKSFVWVLVIFVALLWLVVITAWHDSALVEGRVHVLECRLGEADDCSLSIPRLQLGSPYVELPKEFQGGYFECSQYTNITKWFILAPGQTASEVTFPGELRNQTGSMWCDVNWGSGWVWYDSSDPQRGWFKANNCKNTGDTVIAINWSVKVCVKENFVRYVEVQ